MLSEGEGESLLLLLLRSVKRSVAGQEAVRPRIMQGRLGDMCEETKVE